MLHCDWSNLNSAEESNMHHVTPLALYFGIVLEKVFSLTGYEAGSLEAKSGPTLHKIDKGSSDRNAWLSFALQFSSFVAECGRMLFCSRLAAVTRRTLLCGSDA